MSDDSEGQQPPSTASDHSTQPAKKTGFWASLAPDPDVLAQGSISNAIWMKIYCDGTFTTKSTFGAESPRDTLIAFEHDLDSMRRKSATGRGAAFLATGGLSIVASNNRGVVYATVTGQNSGVRTFKTRNPTNTTLTSVRKLKAAADSVVGRSSRPEAPTNSQDSSLAAQLAQLADLHRSGALSDDEFAAAKAALLER